MQTLFGNPCTGI